MNYWCLLNPACNLLRSCRYEFRKYKLFRCIKRLSSRYIILRYRASRYRAYLRPCQKSMMETVRKIPLRKKRPNTEFFLVRIFVYSDWIQENTDQKKLRIWTRQISHLLSSSFFTFPLETLSLRNISRRLLLYRNTRFFISNAFFNSASALLNFFMNWASNIA